MAEIMIMAGVGDGFKGEKEKAIKLLPDLFGNEDGEGGTLPEATEPKSPGLSVFDHVSKMLVESVSQDI